MKYFKFIRRISDSNTLKKLLDWNEESFIATSFKLNEKFNLFSMHAKWQKKTNKYSCNRLIAGRPHCLQNLLIGIIHLSKDISENIFRLWAEKHRLKAVSDWRVSSIEGVNIDLFRVCLTGEQIVIELSLLCLIMA